MAADPRVPRVLILTGEPLDGPEGPASDLARGLVRAMPYAEYLWLRRWWGTSGTSAPGRAAGGGPCRS
ncbi:hypothetical protein ACRAR1_28460 [Streptomyces sanyensis]|uniref:hypothetical protein n=1 Tax=Streptomyces sanyensis TaxID=568869 RepID=UPI003D774857